MASESYEILGACRVLLHVLLLTLSSSANVRGLALTVSRPSRVSGNNICEGLEDGYHTGVHCKDYWLCRSGIAVLRRSCSEGTLFNGLMCVPAALAHKCTVTYSKGSVDMECGGLRNGLHRNYHTNSCRDYVICENGRATLKGSCRHNLTFDGYTCVESDDAICNIENNNTEDEGACEQHASPGLYASSDGHHYYYCNKEVGVKSQQYGCPHGHVFDASAQTCVRKTGHNSTDSTEFEFCVDKTDGYYQDWLASGCRSYVFCSQGKKIIYLCPEGYAFNGTSCQVDTSFMCPYWSKDCVGKPNGYHADPSTGCRQYFYCLNENRVMTLTCSMGRLFDGSRCVSNTPNVCTHKQMTDRHVICEDKFDGKHEIPGSNCQSFVLCRARRQVARGTCAKSFIFLGNDCVKVSGSAGCNGTVVNKRTGLHHSEMTKE